nr:uncharacterized protein LOC113818373 [Penaeus vannamei]
MNAQAGTPAAPAQPTTVIVVNQDMRRRAPPHMLRGTRLYGINVRAGCMTVSLVFGIFFIIFGVLLIQLPLLTGFYGVIAIMIVFVSFGGFLIYFYVKASRKALREYNDLPADHPDRLKYSGVNLAGVIPGSHPVANVYQFPANAQLIHAGSGQAAAMAPGQTFVHLLAARTLCKARGFLSNGALPTSTGAVSSSGAVSTSRAISTSRAVSTCGGTVPTSTWLFCNSPRTLCSTTRS